MFTVLVKRRNGEGNSKSSSNYYYYHNFVWSTMLSNLHTINLIVTRIKIQNIKVRLYFNIIILKISLSITCLFYLVGLFDQKPYPRITYLHSVWTWEFVSSQQALGTNHPLVHKRMFQTETNQNLDIILSSGLQSRESFNKKELCFKNYLGIICKNNAQTTL